MARTLSYSGDGEGDGQQCGTVIVHVDMPDTGLHRLHQAHLCRAVLLQRTSTIIIIIILWLQRQFTLLAWCCGKKPHSSLQSHKKALEKECCLLGVFRDSGDTPDNLLCELNGLLMPCTSCFYGKWVNGYYYYYYYYLTPVLNSHAMK